MNREGLARYPSLYEINTRVWLCRLSQEAGKPVTLADIDDATLDDLARRGFDWIWLLSVWQTGAASRLVSRSNPAWQAEFRSVLPDLTEEDISGSGFAIGAYEVDEALGGKAALAAFRARLAARGLRLMLDFAPNHTALDHPWVKAHPDFYVEGSEQALAAAPQNYRRVETDQGARILAYGRDPNFPGWPDTLQLDYANPALQAAKMAELLAIAEQCDGVRCDMAMLLLPEVFQRTWGRAPAPFWPTAIAAVRRAHPGFTFLAEAYWDLEWDLQQQGFDYCYDKRLYDRLHNADAGALRAHLAAGLDYQDRLARFLENHDEPRAAAIFPWPQHQAAAIVTYFAPGLRFFHQGQLDGRPRARAGAFVPRSGRGPGSGCRRLLRQAAGGAERTRHVSRRRLVVDPAPTGLGRQSDVAGFHLLCLASARRRRPRRRRQLLRSSGAMPSAVALQRLGRPPVPADRHDGQRSLRPRRQRLDRSGPLHRPRRLALQCLQVGRGRVVSWGYRISVVPTEAAARRGVVEGPHLVAEATEQVPPLRLAARRLRSG